MGEGEGGLTGGLLLARFAFPVVGREAFNVLGKNGWWGARVYGSWDCRDCSSSGEDVEEEVGELHGGCKRTLKMGWGDVVVMWFESGNTG